MFVVVTCSILLNAYHIKLDEIVWSPAENEGLGGHLQNPYKMSYIFMHILLQSQQV